MVTVIPPENKSVLVEQDNHHNRHDRQGYGFNEDQPYRPAERLKDAIAESLDAVLEQIGNTVVSVEKNGRSAELATEKTGAATALAIEKIGAAGQLATERTAAAVANANASNFANTQNMLITGFKDGRFDAATLTASILQSQVSGFKDARYDAATNHATLAAAMAECCCEIKSLVSKEGDETRALMNAIDGRRADRELVDAKAEATLLKLQLAQVSRTTPVVT
jgi:hypothetical protein